MARTARRALGYRWHLRQLMARHNMFATTDLSPLLAERDIFLSPAQVYRLVTGTPERLSLKTLVALCDILDCGPGDLIEPVVEIGQSRRSATGGDAAAIKQRTPRRAEIRRQK
jgi:DNA-binding Xre family transcriptional regulator